MGNAVGSGVSTVRLADVPSGSILLVRQETATSVGHLDPSIVRGVASAQRGGIYSVQQQSLATWTHCALIIERKSKRYIVQASPTGVSLVPAARHVQKLQAAGARIAVRRLAGPMTEDMSLLLTSLLHAAAAGCEWEHYMPEVAVDASLPGAAACTLPAVLLPGQHMRLPRDEGPRGLPEVPGRGGPRPPFQASGVSSPGGPPSPHHSESQASSLPSLPSARNSNAHTQRSGGGSSARSADLSPFARQLIRMLIPCVYGALQALPPRLAVELRRAFGVVDTNRDGRVHIDEVARVLTEMRGAAVSAGEARLFVAAMDVASPDAVSMDHFHMAFARKPLHDIPLEHDLEAIMCGEFVACIYELLGLLPQRRAATAAAAAPPLMGASARGGDGPLLSSSGFSSPAATRSRSGSEAGAGGLPGPLRSPADSGGAASGRRSSVTSTDSSSRGGRPPRPPIVAHDPSHFSATAAAVGSPGVTPSSSGAAAGGPLSRGTVVVVDAVEPDFRHFTPSSFSTLHRPRLQLLRGRLEPEEVLVLDASHDGGDAGHSPLDARAVPGAGAAAAVTAAETAAAVHALTAGTALGDPAARPSTAASRAASRAGASPSDAPPAPAAAYVSARAPRLDEREPSRLLPPLRVSDGGAGEAGAGIPPPLPTTSVLQRGGEARHSPGWGGAAPPDGGGHTVAIDVARASSSNAADAAGAAGGSWRQAARRT